MVEKILQFLSVSCSHKKISQPFTAAAAVSASRTAAAAAAPWENIGTPASHYVVCLECGKKFSYDWNKMRIVR